MKYVRYVYVLFCLPGLLLLAACEVAVEADQEVGSIGGESPEAVITGFLDTLNQALADPELTSEEARRAWAERLASYFVPSERVDQRTAMLVMLNDFNYSRAALDEHEEISLEVTYTGTQVSYDDDERARVDLIDGVMHYRRIWVADNGYRNVLRDRQHPLEEVLNQGSTEGFPVLRVGSRWFLTER